MPREIDEQSIVTMGQFLARYGAVEFARAEDTWGFLSDGTGGYENVKGVVSTYRSPAGNCVSENTAFKGTYKDGSLRIKSGPLKSQFADGRACGGIAIEAKVDGGRASGTLTVGSEVFPIDLEAK